MAKAKILVLAGDGIGPEVMAASIEVMEKAAKGSGLKFNFEHALAGGCSFDQNGTPLTDEVLKKAKTKTAFGSKI